MSVTHGPEISVRQILENHRLCLLDSAVWDEVIHPLWQSRNTNILDALLRLLIASKPDHLNFYCAYLHLSMYQGLIYRFPSPRVVLRLAPTNGRVLVYKRLFHALSRFHSGDIDGSISTFRQVARAMPNEIPFCFGANLRREPEIRKLLRSTELFKSEISSFPSTASSIDNSPIILVSADRKYLNRLGDQFFGSVSERAPGAQVHVHYCDFEGDWSNWLRSLQERWDKIMITASQSRGLEMHRPAYFACARLLILPTMLKFTNRPILVVDLDSELLCDPQFLSKELGDVDVGLCDSGGTSFWNKIQANFVWMAPTPRGIRFAEDLSAYVFGVLSSAESAWMLDQTALWLIKHITIQDDPGTVIMNLRAVVGQNGTVHDFFTETVIHRSVSRIMSRIES